MSEWPKKLPQLQATPGGWEVEVVPADLAQELYEALKIADRGIAMQAAIHGISHRSPGALARYEREVSQ